MKTFRGYHARYVKHGGVWIAYDLENMTIMGKFPEVGILFKSSGEVIRHGGVPRNVPSALQAGELPDHVRYVIFSVHDSEGLLNQILSDRMAASLLFSRPDLHEIMRGSMN